jgi:4-hydroxybenzoate polyprenyltransferase
LEYGSISKIMICATNRDIPAPKGIRAMPSEQSTSRIAIALTILYVVAVLLYGLLIMDSLLLASLIALPGVLVYLLWRYLIPK